MPILVSFCPAVCPGQRDPTGGYQVFAVRPTTNPRGASKEAAAAAAVFFTLLGAIPDGPAKTKGIAIGQEVATAWLAIRNGDGREASVPYTFGPGLPGVYQRTTPGANAVAPWLAVMRPFAMTRVSQFRAPGPPDLTSDLYAKDLKFTQALSALNSTVRTAEGRDRTVLHGEADDLLLEQPAPIRGYEEPGYRRQRACSRRCS